MHHGKPAIMDLRPVWESMSNRAKTGRLNEAHLQRALMDDLLHQRLMRTEKLRLPPTLEWVFRFPEDFAAINMAHAPYLRQQCTNGRYQAVVRQRLLRSSKLVDLFPEGERLPLLSWLLSNSTATIGWPSEMLHGGFPQDVIATLIEGRVVDRASAKAFLLCEEDGVWRFFHGTAFTQVITRCAVFTPDLVLESQSSIERHLIEFDPETVMYTPPLPEARTIMRSILLRGLTKLFEEIESRR